ncbi:hypothetical protein [Synoicihabitans lomoniglobus]|uniref:SMP-30/Gluconolactonase/LRE-like region domain-containing protein n=1 Tax=Synoicihabitans lomoniglobus TaxID=2909285 RepID=A0AAF0CS29_9BACT|nr:hypothetical protein [Opitutaceae bacterium LMO-M01]WED67059.1 hypothetical protein PXH66_09370 [Opitutaceae bacterium LMO-M01]
MKRSAFAVLALSITAALGLHAHPPELLWESDGFMGPESIVYDQPNDVYYVSNMGTYGDGATPGDGFISRVSTAGTILDLKWVEGFDNPKGLAVANGRLYVGDDNDMVEIDLASGKIVARHAPADGEPAWFNDCTADPDGNVYVFSPRVKAVFRLHAGKFEPWVQIDTSITGGLNGLRAEAERLLLGGWSHRISDEVEELGHISTVSYATKTIGRLGNEPICHIDGLEPDGHGGYTTTDWLTGDVMAVTSKGKPTKIMTLVQGSADHEYVIEKSLLLIPLMKDDVVRAYRWNPML